MELVIFTELSFLMKPLRDEILLSFENIIKYVASPNSILSHYWNFQIEYEMLKFVFFKNYFGVPSPEIW
jgi:hypothetical protein